MLNEVKSFFLVIFSPLFSFNIMMWQKNRLKEDLALALRNNLSATEQIIYAHSSTFDASFFFASNEIISLRDQIFDKPVEPSCHQFSILMSKLELLL